MNILFYAPFKPVNHPIPSGDRVIGSGIVSYLAEKGHQIHIASTFRSRWFYHKPHCWPRAAAEFARTLKFSRQKSARLWLTYHTYYKSPDIFGPYISRLLGMPYAIFQGIYSTKVKRRFSTWPGYQLNRAALSMADMLFTNRRDDYVNLLRIKPPSHVRYIYPGIFPDQFRFDPKKRRQIRLDLNIGENETVLVSAAMFRPGVKAKGLEIVISTCSRMLNSGADFKLIIAGDGREFPRLFASAGSLAQKKIHFIGKTSRKEMPDIYSAGDIFVFPGIRESLGMVYLEAQSCGLPVIAFQNGGVPEVVKKDQTGILIPPPFFQSDFEKAISRLLKSKSLQRKMGMAAQEYVRKNHDLNINYQFLETQLLKIVRGNFP